MSATDEPVISRATIESIVARSLEALDPEALLRESLRCADGVLYLEGRELVDLDAHESVHLLALGKSAAAMAHALEEIVGPERPASGLAVTSPGRTVDCARTRVVEGSHPIPDEASLRAAEALEEAAGRVGPDDAVLVLISGGGSALLADPAPGISLEAWRALFSELLASGASIEEVNSVRKHCASLKGGRLMRLLAPARVVTLALSDVIGDPLDAIASGPTVPDPTTFEQAFAVVERYDLESSLPAEVVEHLRAGLRGEVDETPGPGDAIFERGEAHVLAGVVRAVEEVAAAVEEETDWSTQIVTTSLQGEAQEVARAMVAVAREVADRGRPFEPPICLLYGGETTVTVRGEGRGGRNQELALACALELEPGHRVCVVTLATDGEDGPTEAAGAVVDGATIGERERRAAHAALADNDSYNFLGERGALIETGAKRTNLLDVALFFIERSDDPGSA